MALADSVRLAVGTLTVLPVGPVPRVDRTIAGRAMLLAPLAVVPLAVGAAGAGLLATLAGLPALLCGLVAVAALTLGTRAMHLDGLADTVDGLGSGWDADKALAVMRRGDVGPMGVTALILVLTAEVAAGAVLLTSWQGAIQLAVVICCSRAALVLVCRSGVPAARSDGLGAAVAGSVPRPSAVGVGLGCVAVLTAVGVWRGQPWWLGLLASALAALAVAVLVRRCVRRFGGVTGDVMGAAVETALTALVVVLVAR